MNILVVGKGGREHALTRALARSALTGKLYAAPGNPGMAELAECVPIRVDDGEELASFAAAQGVDMVVVGPDGALAAGVVDAVERRGIKAFGPTREAARIESSKTFAKQLMRKENIPTADYASFSDFNRACDHVRRQKAPVVVKADGLAAGKGVVICRHADEAISALRNMMVDDLFGASGHQVVLEEFLEGEEASVFVVTDGETAIPLIPSQDHKQIYDGDTGPNTGGMGAYAPAPLIDAAALDEVMRRIALPAIHGLKRRGLPYRGALYIGLMMTASGPKVIEFNCRFGDPETQALLPLLESDFAEMALAACENRLAGYTPVWRPASATCVILASEGYPGTYTTGKPISGMASLASMEDVIPFHADTAIKDGRLVTGGGRVLGITALGADLQTSIERAYDAVTRISFEGCYYRKDIGQKGLARVMVAR